MNKPIVIVAGGPSLTKEDVIYAENSGVDIMGVNDAYRICKRLNYLYACDRRWWHGHYTRVGDLPRQKYSMEKVGYPDVIQMTDDGVEGLSLEWPKLKNGKNSGYQAINLAILLGYDYIILLGYNMQHTGGKVHWFGDHPNKLNNAPLNRIKAWIGYYNDMVKLIPENVKVINATRETALTCFPRIDLKRALNGRGPEHLS